MNKGQAVKIAEDYVEQCSEDCSLLYDKILEFEYGFSFIWNSRTYIRTKNINDMLVGPAAFIVPKDGSEIYCLGSAYSCESLINDYTNFYEEKHGTYSLWIKSKLTNATAIRQKYSISLLEFKNAIIGTSPLIKGSKARLEIEKDYIAGLGNEIELKKT